MKSLSIILPAYNEGQTIGNFIKELKSLNKFEEIICVDNNSKDNTKKEIINNNGKYYLETKKGFGAAVKKGCDVNKSDYFFICEPDASFSVSDVKKFLEKLEQGHEIVFGSRTRNIEKFYLKFGNFIYAKIIQILFNGPNISDVGCSFRLVKKEIYLSFCNDIIFSGPEFQVELTLNLINKYKNIVEIPVKYKERIGSSSYTGNFYSSLKVAISMFKVIILKFLKII
tara:strand:- start:964 stop:1644 length:681 start_codon:yes stop_codon:yes gene_type:complete